MAKKLDMIQSLKEAYKEFQVEYNTLKDSYTHQIEEITEKLKDRSTSDISIIQNLNNTNIINL